jgi:hypothetical protein
MADKSDRKIIPFSVFLGFGVGVLVDLAFVDLGGMEGSAIVHFLVVAAFTAVGYFWADLLRFVGWRGRE